MVDAPSLVDRHWPSGAVEDNFENRHAMKALEWSPHAVRGSER